MKLEMPSLDNSRAIILGGGKKKKGTKYKTAEEKNSFVQKEQTPVVQQTKLSPSLSFRRTRRGHNLRRSPMMPPGRPFFFPETQALFIQAYL